MAMWRRGLGLVVSSVLVWAAGCAHEAKPPPLAVEALGWAEPPLTPDEIAVAKSVRDLVVHFDFDSSYLSFDNREKLQRVAEVLHERPSVTIRISGHCDEVGTEEYNLMLGERRAEGALRYLTALGIPESRLKTISYGKERPVDSRRDPDAYAANRRDEFEVYQELAQR
jgi:peptidoglycan-associated lipoprotein